MWVLLMLDGVVGVDGADGVGGAQLPRVEVRFETGVLSNWEEEQVLRKRTSTCPTRRAWSSLTKASGNDLSS